MSFSEIIKGMENDIYKQIGKRIRVIRKRLGITQEQLAFASGVHPSFISHIERGTKKVSLETLRKLADALDVKMDEIFTMKKTYPPQKEDLFTRKISTLLKDKDEHFKYTVLQVIKNLEKLEKSRK